MQTEVERARAHLLECQKLLEIERAGMTWRAPGARRSVLGFRERQVLAALSWVWDAQQRAEQESARLRLVTYQAIAAEDRPADYARMFMQEWPHPPVFLADGGLSYLERMREKYGDNITLTGGIGGSSLINHPRRAGKSTLFKTIRQHGGEFPPRPRKC